MTGADTILKKKSAEALPLSGTSYKEVDLSSEDFEPTNPFKALHVGGDGNITIVGIDGVAVTMAVTAGLWPYGGKKLVRATTTATDIVAIY